MKMSSFVVGAVIGMAGAVMIAKRQPALVNVTYDVMSSLKGKMMNKSTSKNAAQNKTNMQAVSSEIDHQANTALIESIISSDPKLKSAVNEITDGNELKH